MSKSRKKWPPISSGTRVKTLEESTTDWSAEAAASRKWGVQGEVVNYHDSHGLCYEVKHEDGTIGHYDPTELKVV